MIERMFRDNIRRHFFNLKKKEEEEKRKRKQRMWGYVIGKH